MPYSFPLILRILCLFLLVGLSSCRESFIQQFEPSAETLAQFETLTLDIQVDLPFTDPYDPDDIRLDLYIAAPDGNEIILPCFYREGPSGNSQWAARFSPRLVGEYSYYLNINSGGKAEKSDMKSFQVTPSTTSGFLHLNPASPWTLKFDSGELFRGVGENFAWEARPFEDPKFTYAYQFEMFETHHANFTRIWMCPWNLPLEWKNVEYNRFQPTDATFNRSAIERMDEMVRLAEQHGVYVMLVLDYHGALKTEEDVWGGNNWWVKHNYHVNQGGFARQSEEFFTHPEAKRRYKNRLRYLVARWGYSSHIAAWEFWNEVDHAIADEGIPVAVVEAWHQEMATYLKSIDPYDHLVTTSVSHRNHELFAIPELDLAQSHLYGKTYQIPGIITQFNDQFQKPYIVGEFAFDWLDVKPERMAQFDRELHDGLWLGMFSPTPILPMTWWWDSFDLNGSNVHFTHAGTFLQGMMEAGDDFEQRAVTATSGVLTRAVRVDEKIFVWGTNRGTSMVSATFSMDGFESGTYQIRYYNPWTGDFFKEEEVVVSQGEMDLGGISLEAGKDVAVVVEKKG